MKNLNLFEIEWIRIFCVFSLIVFADFVTPTHIIQVEDYEREFKYKSLFQISAKLDLYLEKFAYNPGHCSCIVYEHLRLEYQQLYTLV